MGPASLGCSRAWEVVQEALSGGVPMALELSPVWAGVPVAPEVH